MKKIPISNKKQRVVLSDVLPYELPITFSNRHFFDFLVENKIDLKGSNLSWTNSTPELKLIIKLLFGAYDNNNIQSETINSLKLKPKVFKTIPFGYKIAHKQKDFRELTVIHPLNQLSLIEFYDTFKELILYYCSISPFSIRRPIKTSKYTFFKDKTHFELLAHDHEHKTVEEFDKEYENLKTYFVYKEISNVYKFYESYKYQRCEKKYNKLFKFDISKCFDSIYSHSITWALLSKDLVKDNVEESNKTFGGHFDRLMQNLNYNETNGIVIGPEFSRIFAEIILQRIDIKVQQILKESTPQLIHKRDYELFRYIDDYFVFFNEDSTLETILQNFRLQLKEYKLYINNSKSILLEKPIITGITRAKFQVADLLNDKLSFRTIEEPDDDDDEKVTKDKQYSFYVSSNKLITRFKIIIRETEIAYEDILNYTLACIDRKVQKLINNYSKIEQKNHYEYKITQAVLEILDFSFFLYSVSPKVNTTIKLCIALSKLIKFMKIKGNFNNDNIHLVYKKIYDDVFLVLKKYKSAEHTQVETLYLLIVLKQLGREYRVDESVLCQHFGIDLKNKRCLNQLNYFSVVVLLFYIENKKRYYLIKSILKNYILEKYENTSFENRGKITELTLLFFDLIACPYLDRSFKNKLFNLYGIESKMGRQRTAIINYKDNWFTKWTNFDFSKELEAKKSKDVY